jgi:hypothetical protein
VEYHVGEEMLACGVDEAGLGEMRREGAETID